MAATEEDQDRARLANMEEYQDISSIDRMAEKDLERSLAKHHVELMLKIESLDFVWYTMQLRNRN